MREGVDVKIHTLPHLFSVIFLYLQSNQSVINMSDLIKELKKDREFFSVNNQNIIDTIYDLCIKHIKFLNSMGNTNYVYQVPMFLLGFPVYDINTVS